MNWFRRKSDPISDRARELSSEIEALEAQIRQYELTLHEAAPPPEPARSPFTRTATPPSRTVSFSPRTDPDLEDIAQARLTVQDAESGAPVNELGLRKYDLMGVVKRAKEHLRPATTSNPKLVNYLAAGGIQGLRPLRYERRIARNRFLLLFGIFFLVLLGVLSVFLRQP
jgi:hypothetical protein